MSKAVAKRVPTPKPVVVEQVCSICDEDWAEHPEDATVMDCVEILKSKRGIKLADVCCGHDGHNCCHGHHFWHYWYQQPYQITYTHQPVWYNTGDTTTTIGISPVATNTAQLASLGNALGAEYYKYRA